MSDYITITKHKLQALEVALADWQRHGVKVTTECETCGGWGDIDFPTSPHGHRPLDDSDDTTCPDCDGSGRVLAEGVRFQSFAGLPVFLIPAHMIEGDR